MNISINNTAIRALVTASALGAAFAGGVVSGQASGTPQQPATIQTRIVEKAPAAQYVYYVVDSHQAALNVERAEYVTAQEQVLTGIVAPHRVVHITDDSAAGRMTVMEQVFVAQQPQSVQSAIVQKAGLDERAEYVTAQERVLTGIVAPERVASVADGSAAGHMTAMEQVLVATGGR